MARRHWKWMVAIPVGAVVAVLVGGFVYVHVLDPAPPPPLSFADLGMTTSTTQPQGAAIATTSTSSAASPGVQATVLAARATNVAGEVDGTWQVGQGTQARYNVKDTVVGMSSRVVGATPDVTGSLAIAANKVTATTIVVNMQTVACNCQHDDKYHEMLETDRYPTSSFALTTPIALASIPANGQVASFDVTGNFTIHGVTRSVTFALSAVRQAGRIAVQGSIPVELSDYNIENPNNSFGSVSDCHIEFLVAFDRA